MRDNSKIRAVRIESGSMFWVSFCANSTRKNFLGRSEQSRLFHVFCSEYKPSGWKLKTVNLDRVLIFSKIYCCKQVNPWSLLLPFTNATITFISWFMQNIAIRSKCTKPVVQKIESSTWSCLLIIAIQQSFEI